MKLFDLLTDFHNWVSDKDFVWWPFSFLRPEPNEFITMKIVLMMTGCFGGLAFLMFAGLAVANNAFDATNAISTLIACFLGFFLWFACITRPLWNRRTRSLQK